MKSEKKEIRNRVGKNEGRIDEIAHTVETKERVQRSLNMRVYGFDYSKCKVASADDPTKFEVVSPKELIKKMMIEGMMLTEDVVKGINLRKCHWVSKKYILCGFTTAEDKQIFNKGKYNLKTYSPHGHPLSIKGDPTKLQTQEYQDVAALALQLRTKGHVAFSNECRIRIGTGATAKWYHYTDAAVQQYLTTSNRDDR